MSQYNMREHTLRKTDEALNIVSRHAIPKRFEIGNRNLICAWYAASTTMQNSLFLSIDIPKEEGETKYRPTHTIVKGREVRRFLEDKLGESNVLGVIGMDYQAIRLIMEHNRVKSKGEKSYMSKEHLGDGIAIPAHYLAPHRFSIKPKDIVIAY